MTPQEEFNSAFAALETEWGRDTNNQTPKDRRFYAILYGVITYIFFGAMMLAEKGPLLNKFMLTNTIVAIATVLSLILSAPKLKTDNNALRKATNQMIRALARLSHVDPHDLTSAELSRLHKVLTVSTGASDPLYDARLALAVIDTLAKVGGKRSLFVLENLARRNSAAPGQQRIASAARKCVAAIEKRREHEAESMTLLRAADDDALSATLLRPAKNSEDAQELLLHPAAKSEQEDHE
jgi:hypothetical protein